MSSISSYPRFTRKTFSSLLLQQKLIIQSLRIELAFDSLENVYFAEFEIHVRRDKERSGILNSLHDRLVDLIDLSCEQSLLCICLGRSK